MNRFCLGFDLPHDLIFLVKGLTFREAFFLSFFQLLLTSISFWLTFFFSVRLTAFNLLAAFLFIFKDSERKISKVPNINRCCEEYFMVATAEPKPYSSANQCIIQKSAGLMCSSLLWLVEVELLGCSQICLLKKNKCSLSINMSYKNALVTSIIFTIWPTPLYLFPHK